MSSIHSRPKYGKLIFIDRNAPETSGNISYGQSFIVLNDLVKHCSLFNRRDSINGQHGNMTPCSYLNLEYLLYQSSDTRLKAIAELAINGTASPYHHSSSWSDPNHEEYIEVLLPSIEFLKAEFVQYIFIHTNEYQLNAEDIHVLSLSGIPYCNHNISSYPELYQQFINALEKNDFDLMQVMIKQHPLLEKLIGTDGKHLTHSAAMRGNLQHIQELVSLGHSLQVIDHQGRTPFMCAMTTQTPEFIQQFAALFPEVTSISGRDDTPLMFAIKNAPDEMFFAVLTFTPLKIINQKNAQGESALFQAVATGNQNKVRALLDKPEIDYVAMRDPGDKKTAFDLARESKSAIITKLIIAHTIKLRSNNALTEAEINTKIEYEFSITILDDIEQLFRFHFNNFSVITKEIQSIITEFNQLYTKFKTDEPMLDIKDKCLRILDYLTTTRLRLHQPNNSQLLMWKSHSDTTAKLNQVIKAIKSYLIKETTFLNEDNTVSLSSNKNILRDTIIY